MHPPTKKNTLGLLRHAMTLWNEEKRIQGQQNSPLSPTGVQMASAWGDQLSDQPWDLILTSDLGRAMETVVAINSRLQLPVYTEARLREQDWGDWAGLTLGSLRVDQTQSLQAQERAGWQFRPPGGESRQETLVRSTAALVDAARRWPSQNILVVCHEGVIKCLLYHLTRRRFLPEEPRLLHKGYYLHLLTTDGRNIELSTLHHLRLSW